MRLVRLINSVLKNRRGDVPRPSWCTFLVTYRCNARCQMCDAWKVKAADEMSVDEIDAVFSGVGPLDIVRISGGEPFLRKDLPAIAAAILRRSRPSVIHLTTNGSFPDRIVEFVRRFPEPRRLRFMVSFDGVGQTHTANRGKAASFERALKSLTTLAELKREVGLGGIWANHTVISQASLDDHDELVRTVAPYADVHTVLAYADSAMYGEELRGKRADHLIVPEGYPLHPALAGADVVGFVERELAGLGRSGDRLVRFGKTYYLQGLLARLRGDDDARPNPRCVALRSHLRILPDGGVPVCQFNTQVVGNLRTQSFDEVWASGEAARSRRWIDACPGCWAECEVIPNAIYTADLLLHRLPGRSRRSRRGRALLAGSA